MTDYISREEALMAVTRAKLPDATPDGVPIANGKRSVTDCVRRIKAIPSADVAPVRHGEWVDPPSLEDNVMSMCSVCHHCFIFMRKGWNYCPNCGARMDGEE